MWIEELFQNFYKEYVEALINYVRLEESKKEFRKEIKGDAVISQDLVFIAVLLKKTGTITRYSFDLSIFHPSRRLIDAICYIPEVFISHNIFEKFKEHIDNCTRCATYFALVSGELIYNLPFEDIIEDIRKDIEEELQKETCKNCNNSLLKPWEKFCNKCGAENPNFNEIEFERLFDMKFKEILEECKKEGATHIAQKELAKEYPIEREFPYCEFCGKKIL